MADLRSPALCPPQGDVQAVPTEPEVAACMGASGSLWEVPEPQSAHASGMQMLCRGGRRPERGRFSEITGCKV